MKLRPNALIIWLAGLSALMAVGAVIQVTRNESKTSKADVERIVQQIGGTAICSVEGVNQDGNLILLCHAPKTSAEKKKANPKGVVASHGNPSPSNRPGASAPPSHNMQGQGQRPPETVQHPGTGGGPSVPTPTTPVPPSKLLQQIQNQASGLCDRVDGLGLAVSCP